MKKNLALALISLQIAQPALAWGDREQGVAAGMAIMWLWNKLDDRQRPAPQPQPTQQFPTYQPHPQQFIPQQHMPIPTGFQEPCQFPGHHARIYDRYGQPIAIRVC